MGRAAVVLLSVFAIGLAVMRVHSRFSEKVSNADYRPIPAFRAEDQLLVRKAYDWLVLAVELDENAVRNAHHKAVRDFARTALKEHTALQERLRRTVAAINADFEFEPAAPVYRRRIQPGAQFDWKYLQAFSENHRRQSSMLDDAGSIQDNPALSGYAAAWKPLSKTHLEYALELSKSLRRGEAGR